MTFLALGTLFLLALTSTAGEIALSAILGVVGTFVTQIIKKFSGTSGNKALILTIIVSGVLGFIAAYSVGGWDSSNIIGSSAIVFSLATIAYRFILSNDAPVEAPAVISEPAVEAPTNDPNNPTV
jgi:hypothetical protein